MNPQNKIKKEWSPELAYAIGLIATDGCLYKDGRHLAFVSKDLQLMCRRVNPRPPAGDTQRLSRRGDIR